MIKLQYFVGEGVTEKKAVYFHADKQDLNIMATLQDWS